VISQAVDQLTRRTAETSSMVTTHGGGKLPLVDQPRRRIEQRDQQLAMLSLKRQE
jgi:hypothetical protein